MADEIFHQQQKKKGKKNSIKQEEKARDSFTMEEIKKYAKELLFFPLK